MSEGSLESKSKVDSAGELSDVDNENCSSGGGGGSSGGDTKRICVDCGTLRTPLWRGGPAGPKSLCNACGIKSRKKRQAAALGIKPEEKKRKRRSNSSSDSDLSFDEHRNAKKKIINKGDDDDLTSSSSNSEGVNKYLDLGFKVPAMKRSAVEKKKRLWKKLGEEERAAVLLMALSSGYVYS